MNKIPHNKISVAARFTLGIAILFSLLGIAMAQDDETDAKIKKLEDQKKIAELENDIAKAKNEKLKTQLPDIDTSKMAAKTSVTGTMIENQMLAFCAMNKTAGQIATNKPANATTIAIYSKDLITGFSKLNLLKVRIADLNTDYAAVLGSINSAPQMGFTVALDADLALYSTGCPNSNSLKQLTTGMALPIGPILSYGVGNILPLLKSELEFTATDVTIDEKELVSKVYGKILRNPGVVNAVYYPDSFPIFQRAGGVGPANSLINILTTLRGNYDQALVIINADEVRERKYQCGISKLRQEEPLLKGGKRVANAQNQANLNTDYNNYLQNVRPDITKLKSLIELTEELLKTLGLVKEKKEASGAASGETTTPPSGECKACSTTVTVNNAPTKENEGSSSGGGSLTLADYIRLESLEAVMNTPTSYWLDVKLTKAGGNMRVKSNLYTSIFTGQRVKFSGGAIVYYTYYRHDGSIAASDIINSYVGYTKSEQLKNGCKIDSIIP